MAREARSDPLLEKNVSWRASATEPRLQNVYESTACTVLSNVLSFLDERGFSSVWESACLASRWSRVQIPYPPLRNCSSARVEQPPDTRPVEGSNPSNSMRSISSVRRAPLLQRGSRWFESNMDHFSSGGSVGRALPCHGRGREFDSRPLLSHS